MKIIRTLSRLFALLLLAMQVVKLLIYLSANYHVRISIALQCVIGPNNTPNGTRFRAHPAR